MNARNFAPIPVGKVLPPHARTFTPVLEPARAEPCRPNLASPKAMQAEITGPNEHENYTLALKLGEAPVDVEFAVIQGEPVVQGCVVHDEWVDVDCLSRRVVDGWRGDIARRMGSDL
jgi:hypothetical protein